MKANIYVDGFNLYYGAVKNTPYRWLDISALCRLLLPKDDIYRIKYFTALVDPRPSDPDQRVRQETYLPQRYPSHALLPHVAFIKQIRAGVLAKSQFPPTLQDRRGSFSKPASW